MSNRPANSLQIPDADVRKRVVAGVHESFIVQAPAGSGKTELLTQRFLALLAIVEQPESVVAITFTRKAASEMRIRILKALDSASRPREDTERREMAPHELAAFELARAVLAADQRHGWKLLENPMRLQIRTVDSLSDSIARQLPMLAGLAGDLQVTEDSRDLYGEASARTIAELGGGAREADAIATLLRYLDNNIGNLRKLLISMLAKRDQWLRIIGSGARTEAQLQELRAELEGALRRAIENDLLTARRTLKAALGADEMKFVELARIAAGHSDWEGMELPAASAVALEHWRAIADLMLTGKGELRKTVTVNDGFENAEDKRSCKEILARLSEGVDAEPLCAALRAVRKLPPARYSDEEWRFVRALMMTLPRSAAQLKVVFAEVSKVDFIEMAMAAKSALETPEGPTELGLAVGSQVKHLLVDEFQDTSQSQLGLVNALTQTWEEGSGNTLFLVGDPMQSIYSFREAEVTIFTRAFQAETADGRDLRWKVKPQKLTANFRSQRGLVEWFNRVHAKILTRDDDATAAVRYSEAEAILAARGNAVTLRGFSPQDYPAEARYIAQQVQHQLDENSQSKIAILVRARSHLVHIVRELEAGGIRFRAVKIDELAKRQTVLDLDAVARAILDLADRTAWLAVLRAPWCGLTLADLWELCRGDRRSTILSLLQERSERLTADGQRRAAKVLKVMEKAIREHTNLPFRLAVERAWIELGGPACFKLEEAEASWRDAKAYLEFIEDCDQAGLRPGSSRFQARLEELYAPAASDPEIRVELMTIHGAKGLEWDVVFLPALGRKPRQEDKQLLYWREQRRHGVDELLLGPTRPSSIADRAGTLEAYLDGIRRERATEEKKRLLYVATTRAKKQLFLTATLAKNGKPETASMLALMWPVAEIASALTTSAEADATATEVEGPGAAARQVLRRLKGNFALPEPPPLRRTDETSTSTDEAEALHTFNWAGETRRRVGTVTHSFLQAIAREGLEHWSGARIDAARTSIRTALVTEGVGPDRIEDAVKEVIAALTNCVSDERGRWILGAKTEAAAEMAVTAVVDGVPRRLKIDRTFVEGNVRWIVDFKTTQIEGGDAERYFLGQVEKYRKDLEQYARAVRGIDAREIKCALYFPLQKELRVVAV